MDDLSRCSQVMETVLASHIDRPNHPKLMNHPSRWTVILLLCVAVFGCDRYQETDGAARDFAEGYYRLVQAERFAEAANLYDERDRAVGLDLLQRTRAEMGALVNYRIHTEEINSVFRDRLYLFISETEYANGSASETLTLRSRFSDDVFIVVSHRINPR
jgi:hypothetical protein